VTEEKGKPGATWAVGVLTAEVLLLASGSAASHRSGQRALQRLVTLGDAVEVAALMARAFSLSAENHTWAGSVIALATASASPGWTECPWGLPA